MAVLSRKKSTLFKNTFQWMLFSVVHRLQFYHKTQLMLNIPVYALLIVFEKRPWQSPPYSKVGGLKVSLQFNQKKTPAQNFPRMDSTIQLLLKFRKNILWDIFAKHFLTKLQASNQKVASLLKITCFNSKGNLYRVNDNL